MYRRSVRDFVGTLWDTFQVHPFADTFRFPRLKVWYWRRFRPTRYALLEAINLGCGPNVFPGMCNVDVAGPADLRFNFLNPFPLPSDVSAFVYCEHTLEHFHVDQVQHILREVHRILRPGGVVRLSVPRVSAPSDPPQTARMWRVDEMEGATLRELNRRLFGHEHKTVFSYPLFEQLLMTAGFAHVVRPAEGQTLLADPQLVRRIEHRGSGNVVAEAQKDPSGPQPGAKA
jgi:predicted SAM-dependent methyltransferase